MLGTCNDACAQESASGYSAGTDTQPRAQPPGIPYASFELVKRLVSSGCSVSKKPNDWAQRIRNLRRVCAFAFVQASQPEEVDLVASLGASLADFALQVAPPNVSQRGSGTARKRCAYVRAIVGDYIGNDIVRAILAAGIPHVADALALMHNLVVIADLRGETERLRDDLRPGPSSSRGLLMRFLAFAVGGAVTALLAGVSLSKVPPVRCFCEF